MNKTPAWFNLLFNKKMLTILALGFASGLPLGLSGSTLQAWYAVDGVSTLTIGCLTLVGLPYIFKFLWAPLMDKYRLPFLGLRRGWMLITQIALIGILCAIALSSPTREPYFLAFLALTLAFLSATQDVAIDAYRTELLSAPERGMGTSMAVTGYRVAMLTSAGISMVVADHFGFSFTYFLMAALMSIGVVTTLLAKEPQEYRAMPPNFLAACIEPFKEFLSRKNALALLTLIVLYKIGDAFAGSLSTTFLLTGVGFTPTDVGVINKTGGFAASLLGVFVGGILMVRWGLFRSLLWFGVVQALTNLLFFGLALMGANYGMLILTVCMENFGAGLGTAAFMALVMSLCNMKYTATQFALISSFSAVGRVCVGPAAGLLIENVGWAEFFLWTVLFSVPGLILLLVLRKTINRYEGIKEKEANSLVVNEGASA